MILIHAGDAFYIVAITQACTNLYYRPLLLVIGESIIILWLEGMYIGWASPHSDERPLDLDNMLNGYARPPICERERERESNGGYLFDS